MIREARLARIRDVAARRLGWVRCAVERVHHRHNTSAILRTCDAHGVQHVHLVGEGMFKPAKGPSMGTSRWLDLHDHDTTRDALTALRDAGVDVWVADLADDAVAPEDVPLDRPVCLWFGAEVIGVSPEARAAAAGVVTVPMRGFAQSLNVSVAAALCLHTVSERARRALGDRARLGDEERTALLAGWLRREVADWDDERARQEAVARLGARFAPGG